MVPAKLIAVGGLTTANGDIEVKLAARQSVGRIGGIHDVRIEEALHPAERTSNGLKQR